MRRYNGVVLEWLKRHAWKACNRQNRFPSSNLGHSAQLKIPQAVLPAGFFAIETDDTYVIHNRRMQWSRKNYGFIFGVA